MVGSPGFRPRDLGHGSTDRNKEHQQNHNLTARKVPQLRRYMQ